MIITISKFNEIETENKNYRITLRVSFFDLSGQSIMFFLKKFMQNGALSAFGQPFIETNWRMLLILNYYS